MSATAEWRGWLRKASELRAKLKDPNLTDEEAAAIRRELKHAEREADFSHMEMRGQEP